MTKVLPVSGLVAVATAQGSDSAPPPNTTKKFRDEIKCKRDHTIRMVSLKDTFSHRTLPFPHHAYHPLQKSPRDTPVSW